MQANPSDQWTILLIAGVANFSCIITIWISITSRRLEDTLLGAIGTRPTIRILNARIFSIALAFAEGFSHVCAIFAQGLSLSAAGHLQVDTAVFVTWKERKSAWVEFLG